MKATVTKEITLTMSEEEVRAITIAIERLSKITPEKTNPPGVLNAIGDLDLLQSKLLTALKS